MKQQADKQINPWVEKSLTIKTISRRNKSLN